MMFIFKNIPLQKSSQDWSKVMQRSEKGHYFFSIHEINRPQENTR